MGKPPGKHIHGRPSRRWEENLKVNLRETNYEDQR